MQKQKDLPDLRKMSTSYNMIIPEGVEKKIRFMCNKIWDTEWSGVLFYNVVGNFEDNTLEIQCVDIYPMDIGSSTYTEFDVNPDIISYMAENPDLLDCKLGLIHSHNNMKTFFSGTDLNTLQSEGDDKLHFVSLIVNNEGVYSAAITRKVTYKGTFNISYNTFDGESIELPNEEMEETIEIEYFPLDITIEGNTDNDVLSKRIDEINKTKEEAHKPKKSYYGPVKTVIEFDKSGKLNKSKKKDYNSLLLDIQDDDEDYYGQSFDWKKFDDKFKKSETSPTLFDDIEDSPSESDKEYKDSTINALLCELLSGCILSLGDNYKPKDLAKVMVTNFDKRFGDDEVGMGMFEYWAIDFVEFVVWYGADSLENRPHNMGDDVYVLANRLVEELNKLPSNKYIDKYIEILNTYEQYK